MAEIDFDKMLHRQIASGYQYEGLFPAYSGTNQIFEKKNQQSDVFGTIEFMSQWANKYAWQSKKIAPLLAGRNTQETVNNIYNFLYNHFQYKIDQVNDYQNLYSPAAAWHFRKTGFDCKSFSILASTILQCLGIDHSFRMVKQKGLRSAQNPSKWIISPDEWSHVYVIVPDGKKYYVIDATTHDNKEVQFVQKYDYGMQHKGLNGAYSQKSMLGCACQGNALTKSKLGSPANLSVAISNFHKFLNELEKNGISRQVTDRMLNIVRFNIENGINPNMSEVLQKALNGGSLNGGIEFNGGNISVGGVSLNDAATAFTNPAAALTIVKKLIPPSFMTNTFLAVFQNGFHLSCWGSTYTPSQTRNYASQDLPAIYGQTVGKGITEENLNEFSDIVRQVRTKMDQNGHDMGSCSRDAMSQYADAFVNAFDNVIAEISKYYTITKVPVTVTNKDFSKYKFQIPDMYEQNTFQGTHYLLKPIPATITQNPNGTYTVTQPDGSTQVITQQQYNDVVKQITPAGSGSDASGGGASGGGGNNNTKKTDYTVPILIALGIGAKLMFF